MEDETDDGRRVLVVGAGRAGRSFAVALSAAGWAVVGRRGRGDDLGGAAAECDLLLIATPDAAVAEVARAIRPVPSTVVVHLAGSLGLEVLAPHRRRASLHPLMALPSPEVGAARLTSGGWFAAAGDPLVRRLVDDLGGRAIEVADEDRAAYHAAACIASNHLVALTGQVERVARLTGVPLAAYLELARGSLDDVDALGPAAALTGPAARGDEATLERHRAVLDPSEVRAYDALAEASRRLAAEPPTRPGPGARAGAPSPPPQAT